MAQIEPMDIDSEFDNKENSLHHSNVLPRTPCTEKGYEELDVSELNMKLRYSITPASSPMSKSFTANSLDNRTFDSEDYINNVVVNENCNLTRSLNSTITRNDMTKLPKSLPLQELSTESVTENRNSSVLRTLDKTLEMHDNNVTLALNGQNYIDDNMSLPSTSSSVAQTPEATTPTKEVTKHDGGSPIMRGLKSVLNMFRSSQSPIPPADNNVTLKQEVLSPKEPVLFEEIPKCHLGMASTPISNKQKEISGSQRNSPLKESIVFNDDLERELQWKDETTILFKEEKIPIHKLLLPPSLSSITKTGEAPSISSNAENDNIDNIIEHMDISYNDSFSDVKVERQIQSADITNNDPLMIESDGEFVDCETTINNNDISDNKIIDNLTSSLNNQNSLHQSQNLLQTNGEQSIVNIKSETLKNLSLKDNYLLTRSDKNEISNTNLEDCNKCDNFPDSAIKGHDLEPNMVVVLLAENQNEIVSQINEEKNNDFRFSDSLHEGQNTEIEKSLTYLKHPSDIPLPDEDDIENVLNLEPVTITTTEHEELNLKSDHQMDMSIDHNETSMIEKDCLSQNKETTELDLDGIDKNYTEVNEINQEKVNQEIVNAQCTNIIENTQIMETNDNLTQQVGNVPLQEINSIIPIIGELNSETNSEIITDSLEINNGKKTEAVSIEDQTKFDLNINQRENDILVQDNQSAITEQLNEIVSNSGTNLQSMESFKQEHESTFIFENNSVDKGSNINCSNDLESNNISCTINNDGIERSSNKIDSNLVNNHVSIIETEDYKGTMIAPKNIAIESSSTFMQQDNKNFEINMNISQDVQESVDMETIIKSKCTLELHNVEVLNDKTVTAQVEKNCGIWENVEIITSDREILDIDIDGKIENLTKKEDKETLLEKIVNTKKENITRKEGKETLLKEVTDTTDENSTSKTIESEIAFKQNKNEFSVQISPTNEVFNVSLGQEDVFRNIGIKEKSDEFDNDSRLSHIHINDKEKETVPNSNLNVEVPIETDCNTEPVNDVISNVTSNATINIVQEDEIVNKQIKEKEETCKHKTEPACTQVSEIESVPICSSVLDEQTITNVTFSTSNKSTSQENEIEDKRNEETAYEYERQIDAVNKNRDSLVDNESRESKLNVPNIIASNSTINDHVIPNVDSNATFNMSMDQEDIGDSKEIKESLLSICTQENEILDSNNRNSIMVNETGEGKLNVQNIAASNSTIDGHVIPNVDSNSTFNMSIDYKDIGVSKEIKEKTGEGDLKAQENEILESNNRDSIMVNETGEGKLNVQNIAASNSTIDGHVIPNVDSNSTFNMSIDHKDIGVSTEIKEKTGEGDLKASLLNICPQKNEILDGNNRNSIMANETGEAKLNVQNIAASNSTIDDHVIPNIESNATFNMSIDYKDIDESKEIKGRMGECNFIANVLNICAQENVILDSNNSNSIMVKETGEGKSNVQNLTASNSTIDNHVRPNSDSNSTFNMSIEQKDIGGSKEIEGRLRECDLKTNLLNICPQENEILDSNNRMSVVANETGEGILNPRNILISNSNNGDQIISNETYIATFNMIIDQEDIDENKECKEKTDECETEECVINKQNVSVSNSKVIEDLPVPNVTHMNTDDEKVENKFLCQSLNQTNENVSVKDDVIDERNSLDKTDCEVKNDQATNAKQLMDTKLTTSKVLSQNGSDKVEPEIETSDKNIESGDTLTMEIKCQESPPLSPVISSKGYNFNFDEIDDPFATKTRIRSSPPPEDSPESNEKVITKAKSTNNTKKDFQRRKSMPVKKQPQSVKVKNKINSTFSEAVDYEEIKQYALQQTTKKIETANAIVNTTCDNLQVSGNLHSTTPEKSSLITHELPPCQTEDTHNYIDGQTNNKNISKSEVQCTTRDTSLHEAEITSNLSNPTISVEKHEAKNVFNLPEMSSDMNFSPFATRSMVCRTPSPVLEACSSTSHVSVNLKDPSSQSVNIEGNVSNKADHDSSIASSSSKGTQDATVREVNTEDEDTVEGPFLGSDELNDDDKMSDIVADSDDMMNFHDILPQGTDNNDDNAEMFIDAEAFEFLLNQNKSNMVVDSGKESLFLKFDPLFAKRMSSDGVLAALNKVQKRQSTPKRMSKAPTNYCDRTSTGNSNLNATTEVNSTLENNFEDPNTTVSKPMMVVNPAVSSIISPRNKPIATPPRANRRSLTFTSPAIAVIDRLLSLSGNSSTLNSESPTRQVRREPNETDLALTQLRELLAEKEIHVNSLRMESKELKERLSTLETQVKSLESESEQRLRKVNELNDRLVEKTNINRSMAAVVEEYERTIASLIAETEQDKKRHAEERMQLVKERDEQTAHLASMEYSFNDLHSKYEKSKQIILACKSNEDIYKKSIKEFEDSLLKMQNNYELLKQHATSKLNQANQELEKLNRAHEAEVVKLNAMIKRKDLHITSLEETLAQKTKANEELTAICDELINKVG